ncbi:peptide-binding protein, partial [bacterium]|nr:peptide-binding protein [bacterium]
CEIRRISRCESREAGPSAAINVVLGKCRTSPLFSFFLALGIVLTGCSPSGKTRYSGDTIVFSSIGDASFLNPVLAGDASSAEINDLVYNGLVKYDKNLVLTSDLAESWEVSDGGKTIIFKLRKNVKWHDGAPFTSADVVFTYNCLVNPDIISPRSGRFKMIKNVEAPDDYTFVVKYASPYSPALESWGLGIIPKHIFEKCDFQKNPANRNPVGTGAYKFVKWVSGEKIILEKNKEYFEPTGNIGRIIYRIIPDSSVQFLELEKQGIDSMSLTPHQYKFKTDGVEFNKNYNKFRYTAFQYAYIGYNLTNPLFQDKRVRRAIAYAIDKKALVDAVLLGCGKEISANYPPSSWAYNPDTEKLRYDPVKARALLDEAGWKDSGAGGARQKDGLKFSFTLLTNQGNKMREESATIIQSQLKDAGIDMKIRILEWATLINRHIDRKDFDAVLLGWSLAVDPDCYSLWHSSEIRPGGFNFISYSNPEVDALIEKGRRSFDRAERKKIYGEIQNIISADQPCCFLYAPDSLSVVASRFQGIEPTAAGISHNFLKWHVPANLIKYK